MNSRLYLLVLCFWVKLWQLFEGFYVGIRYPRFIPIQLRFIWMYFFKNAYRVHKKYLQDCHARDVYTYGETPITSLAKVSREVGISADDTVFELGAGRCIGAYWLEQTFGCRVVAIEMVPEFCEKAKRLDNPRVQIIEGNMLDVDMSSATVIYFYGTGFEADFLARLIVKFKRELKSSARIITVSYPLTEYCAPGTFNVLKKMDARFPWGRGEIFIQQQQR